MPTTLGGLIVFVGLLVPGFVHHTQRRARVPQRALSPLVETANLVTVSAATNALVLGAFGLYRAWQPEHSPEVGRVLIERSQYVGANLGYLASWGVALLLLSSGLAFVLGARPKAIERFATRFAPSIVDVSTWYYVFEAGAEDEYVYVGCDLRDGAYVAGVLDWYSTEVAETADRDFAIASPIRYRPAGETEPRTIEGFQRLVVSARDVSRMYVDYQQVMPTFSDDLAAAED
ncbi:MAG: putative rane protein [Aeromicrobium sp.]|nr:putative rane protein [Aeromicrobium sp.]